MPISNMLADPRNTDKWVHVIENKTNSRHIIPIVVNWAEQPPGNIVLKTAIHFGGW